MEILQGIGIVLLLILVLVFAVFFTMAFITFVFGLPQIYVKVLDKVGKRLEKRFPKIAKNKNVRGVWILLVGFTATGVLVAAMYFWFAMFDLLP